LDYKQLTQEVAAGSAPVKAALAKSKNLRFSEAASQLTDKDTNNFHT
jgi:hypothetical protein